MSAPTTDQRIERLTEEVRDLRAIMLAMLSGPLASEGDARGQYGDPKVRFDPRTWRARSWKGAVASQCPADYLEQYADSLESMAQKEEKDGKEYKGKPSCFYTRRDASLVRRWALMKRLGSVANAEPEKPAAAPSFGGGAVAGGNPFASAPQAPAAAYPESWDVDDEI